MNNSDNCFSNGTLKLTDEFKNTFVSDDVKNIQSCCEFQRILMYEDMQVVLQNRCECLIELLNKLSCEIYDLDIHDFYNSFYKRLFDLYRDIKRFYPKVDMSTNDVDLMYKRLHMND